MPPKPLLISGLTLEISYSFLSSHSSSLSNSNCLRKHLYMSLKLRNMPFPVKTLLPLYGYLPDLIRIVALIDYFSKKECQLCLHGWQTRHLQLQCQETQRQAPQTAVFFFLNCSIITSQFGHLPFSFNGLPHFPQNFDIINSPASQN